jgi:hypothetical protein
MNRYWRAGMALLWAAFVLSGCATVRVQSLDTREYIAMKRGDILTTGRLSAATQETVLVAGLSVSACAKTPIDCIETLSQSEEIAAGRRWAAQSELWLEQAMTLPAPRSTNDTDRRMAAWLETARYAYAYLFFSGQTASQRAFGERQTQVRDYYNYAVQATVAALFQRDASAASATRRHAGWTIHIDHVGVPLPEGVYAPKELIPANTLSFAGLRSTYRRDGFGAEFVAVMSDDPVTSLSSPQPRLSQGASPYSEMPCPVVTVLFRFPGDDAAQVLGTREAVLSAYDPYRDTDVVVRGERVPLAANFTAGYGLWLAHAGFTRHSLRTLFGRAQDVERAHVYMMQPYDPSRRIIVMLHGFASSPEAWVNLANEIWAMKPCVSTSKSGRRTTQPTCQSPRVRTRYGAPLRKRFEISIPTGGLRHRRTWCSSVTAWAACWRDSWSRRQATGSGSGPEGNCDWMMKSSITPASGWSRCCASSRSRV